MDAIIEQCPACGIRRINGEFYWSTGVVTTPDKVYTRVCRRNKTGLECINKTGQFNEDLDWKPL